MKFFHSNIMSIIITWLAALAVFLLNISTQNFIVSIKIFNTLIVAIGSIILLNAELFNSVKKIFTELKPYLKYVLIIILFISLGQLITWFLNNGAIIDVNLIHNYARVAFNGLIFLLTGILIFINKHAIKYFSWSVFASPLILLTPLFDFQKNIYINGGRLSGLFQDPNIFGGWMVISLIIGIALFFENKSFWKKILITFWLCIISNFILWSASRAGWVALVIGLITFGLILFTKKQYYKTALLIIIPTFVFSVGFLTLPKTIQPFILDRMIGSKMIKLLNLDEIYQYDYIRFAFIEKITSSKTIKALKLDEIYQKDIKNYTFSYENGLLSHQTRTEIWKNAFLIALKNPVGYGFNYLGNHKFIINNETIAFTTNIFLEVLILGGFGALITFIIILKKLIQNIPMILKNAGQIQIAWTAAFFSIITDLFFIDGFLFRYFWFVLGVIFGMYLTERFKSNNPHIA